MDQDKTSSAAPRAQSMALSRDAAPVLMKKLGLPTERVMAFKIEFDPMDVVKLTYVRGLSLAEVEMIGDTLS